MLFLPSLDEYQDFGDDSLYDEDYTYYDNSIAQSMVFMG